MTNFTAGTLQFYNKVKKKVKMLKYTCRVFSYMLYFLQGLYYNFELFRIREKQIPVDKVEVKGKFIFLFKKFHFIILIAKIVFMWIISIISLQKMWLHLPGSPLAVVLLLYMENLPGFRFRFTRSDQGKWKLSVRKTAL